MPVWANSTNSTEQAELLKMASKLDYAGILELLKGKDTSQAKQVVAEVNRRLEQQSNRERLRAKLEAKKAAASAQAK